MEEIPISTNQYPPGIRFHPSDEELISFFLLRKLKSLPLPPNVITDIHLYTFNPWDLPRKSMFGEDEWFFFTPRDRKYPNGGRPNRAAASGYWKATGTDHPIRSSSGSGIIGVKKTLVFYKGRPPCGHRMDWIMTEYKLPDTSRPSRTTGSMRLDDWVLCRIRQKGNMSKNERNLPAVCGSKDYTGMLSEYLQSNEYKLIVSLLAGHDPTTTTTTVFQSSVVSESDTCKEKYATFQSESLAATNDARLGVSEEQMMPTTSVIMKKAIETLNIHACEGEETRARSSFLRKTLLPLIDQHTALSKRSVYM